MSDIAYSAVKTEKAGDKDYLKNMISSLEIHFGNYILTF